MSTPPPLVDARGRPVALDRPLGSGGEGAVYALPADPDRVAKVYHAARLPDAEKVEKLKAMLPLANPRLLAVATWPTDLLFHATTRRLVGFVMDRLIDFKEIWQLYHPVERLKCFPRASWAFQVRAAVNLAAAMDEIHREGIVVGDVQFRNAHVSQQALVRVVDCDSFQVRANGRHYLCKVGQAHYVPPELQGQQLDKIVRTENHDRFGLAVLIYQLLFVGKHPYMGMHSDDVSFEQLIATYRLAQGPMAASWGMAPPPHAPTFADLPPDVGLLFRRAFERGSDGGTRPRAGEWMSALRGLEHSLAECPADAGHKFWRGAGGCVWCRLAAGGGPEYYFGVAAGVGTFAVDEAKLQEVVRRLASTGPHDFPYDRGRFAPAEQPDPEPLPDGLTEHRSTAAVLGVATGLCVLAMPLGLVRGFITVIAVIAALVFGTWFGVLVANSPWRQELRRRRAARTICEGVLVGIERGWERRVEEYRSNHAEMSRRVRTVVEVCRGLASEYRNEVQQLTARAESDARQRHLRLHQIADADIPNIRAGRKQILDSYGIRTAADVEWDAIRGIKGFGNVYTQNLVDWKQTVLSTFRFDPLTALPPVEHKEIVTRFRTRQQKILTELDRKVTEIEGLAPACQASLASLIPRLRTAVAEWEQADADFRLVRHGR